MSTWFIIAQIMGVFTICIDFVTYQIKDQRKYLLVYSIGSVFWTFMFIALGLDTNILDMVPVIIAAAFGILRSMVFWWIFAKKSKKRKIAGKVFLYVALAIGLTAAILSITKVSAQIRWVPIVGLFAALAFIVGQYLPSKHYLRIFACTYAVAMILTQTPLYIIEGSMRWNPMGILIELAKIASIAVYYGILLYRRHLVKKLPQIREKVASEMEKLGSGAIQADGLSADELEKLYIKMLCYELSVIDKSDFDNLSKVEEKIQPVLDGMKSMQGMKDALQKASAQKEQELMHAVPLCAK